MTSFGALKEGIVYRQGGLGLWKKRILILQDEVIYLFSNEKRMEAADSVLVTSITSVTELSFEETKREFSFRIEHKDKDAKEKEKEVDEDGTTLPQKAIVLACASRAELDSWCESIETVRTYDRIRREHEISFFDGGEWGRARPLARETLRASKSVFNKTVIVTGMLKNLRFGPTSGTGSISSGTGFFFSSSAPTGSMTASDAEKAQNSVNLEFFNAAIGEMSILLAKDVVTFLGSPFDGERFQNVSESAKQMINLLATLPKLARKTSNESAVQFHANALQQELQRIRQTRLIRPSDEVDAMLTQLEIEMEKLLDAGENEERLHTSKLLNSCAQQFVVSCNWISDVLDSKEDADLIIQTATDLGPAIDEYRKQAKNEFYFKQGTGLQEERQEIFGILTYCSQLIQDSKRTSVDRFVNSSKKIRQTMLLTAPPAFMQFYDENEDDDGSDESVGSRNSSGSISSTSSSAISIPRSIPARLQIETMFSNSPPLSRSLSHSNSNLTLSSTPPVSSSPGSPFLTQSMSPPLSPPLSPPPLSSSFPDAPSFLGSLSKKTSSPLVRSHSGSSSETFSREENIDDIDPFGGDTPPKTYSFGSRGHTLRTERSNSYNMPSPTSSRSSLRERSISYNVNPDISSTPPLSTPSSNFPLSGLTVEQEQAWDSLISDAEKFVKRYKKKSKRSLKFSSIIHRASPTMPTSPLRNSSSSVDFSPLVHEIGDWDASGEEKLPPSLTIAPPPAPYPTPSSPPPSSHMTPSSPPPSSPITPSSPSSNHVFFSISGPAASFLASRQAKKQAKKAQIAEKKKLIPAASSGANLVLEPKIPSFLTQPAPAPTPTSPIPTSTSPIPTPTSTSTSTTLEIPSSPPPFSDPISPRCLSPPPSMLSSSLSNSSTSTPLASSPIPTPLSPGRVVPLSPSLNFPADSLPPFKILDLPVIDVSSLGEDTTHKRQELPGELANIFAMQEQQLLAQQKQILKQHQEYILQQFEEQRRALAAIQRQALEAHKFVATPRVAEAPRAFVTARPRQNTGPPAVAFLSANPSSPSIGSHTPPPTSTTPPPTSTPPTSSSHSTDTPSNIPTPIASSTETEMETETKTQTETKTETETKAETETKTETETKPETETETESVHPRPPSALISESLNPPSPDDHSFDFSSSTPRPPSMIPQIPEPSSSSPTLPRHPSSIISNIESDSIPRPPSTEISSSAPSVSALARSFSTPGGVVPRPPSILPVSSSLSSSLSEEKHKKHGTMQRSISATHQAHLLAKKSPSFSSLSSYISSTPRPPSFSNPPLSPPPSRNPSTSSTPRPPSFANPLLSSSPSSPISPKSSRATPPESIPHSSVNNNNNNDSPSLSSSPLLSPPPSRVPPGPPRELSSPTLLSPSSPSSSPTVSRAKKMPHPPSAIFKQNPETRKNMVW